MSAEVAGSVVLLTLALVILALALILLNLAVGAARQERARSEQLPRRLWVNTHAVYVDMNGVQPYVLREALYRAGVQVYGIQPPALEKQP